MSEAIISAIITGLFAVLAQLLISARANKTLTAEFQKQSELADAQIAAKLENYRAATDVRLEELTREVREHNNFARRMPVLEEQIRVANHRITDLEKGGRA